MRPLLPLVLLAALPAQTSTPFGTGCGARATTLDGYGSPTAGGTIELHVQSAAPSASHLLIVGLSRTQWSGGSLPFPIPPGLGFAPSCALLVSHDLTAPLPVDATGQGTLPIPLDSTLAGASFYLQAAGLPSAEPWYLTRGVALTIGTAATAPVTGQVRDAAGSPVAKARVTLHTPGLTTFLEVRTDAAGAFVLAAAPLGTFRLGCAALGFDYAEVDLVVTRSGATQSFALAPQSHPGQWQVVGDTLPTTLDATDIAYLLPDGRVFYCHDTDDPLIFDPVTGVKTFPAGSGSEQGCMHGAILEDGSLLAVGGQNGSDPGSFKNAVRWVKTWSSAAGWNRIADLLHPTGRWYPGLARLEDGTLLVMGGGTSPNAARTDTCELFDQATRTWTWTGSMGQAVEFPPAALLMTGQVLRTWGRPQLWDPASSQWTDTGAFVAPSRGWPGHSDHSLVVLSDGKALVVGIDRDQAGSAAAMAELYDPASGTWTARSSPALTRRQAEVTPLPDGTILVAAGDKGSQAAPVPDRYGIVQWCDLYDPLADAWRRVADMLQFREYHAVTVLAADGRVLTTGGTQIKFKIPPQSADIEAYSPPYLFRGVRPRIANPSTTAPRRGASLSFDVFPATTLTSVVLLGSSVHTHWVDAGVPRRLVLPVQQSGTRATVVLPADRNVLPVGHYLAFAMVDDIPSVALLVRVQP